MNQTENPNANPLVEAFQSGTKESGKLASLQDRFVGALIDGVIVGVAASVVSVPLLMTGMIPFLLASVVSAAVGMGVFVAINFQLLKKGQTVGKMVMKTQIVDENGETPELNDLLMKRYSILFLVGAVPYVGPLLSIANAAMIFRDTRCCFHDDIAKTKVVNS